MREPRHRCLLHPTWGPDPHPGQGCTAPRHPCQMPLPSFLMLGKYNGREPGKGNKMLVITSHPEMESWCNWDGYVGLGSCLDPTALEESQHNSSPPSTSPLDLLRSLETAREKCQQKTSSYKQLLYSVAIL